MVPPEIAEPEQLPAARARSETPFRLPAVYYAAPASEVRPIFPRWVPITLGSVAAALLLIVFVGGAIVMHTGLGRVMDLFVGAMQDEMATMYAKDVPAGQKKALDAELSQLRGNLRDDKVAVAKLDPVMKSLRDAIGDERITQAEADKLMRVVHAINNAPKTVPPPRR